MNTSSTFLRLGLAAALFLPGAFFTGCQNMTPGEQALAGAAVGGLIGSAAGHDRKDVLAGAAIGAASGLILGSVAKDQAQVYQPRYNRGYSGYPHGQDRYNAPRQVTPPPQEYPTAYPTQTPGHVQSPHAPNNVIDVKGYRRGEVVLDPTTNRPFRIP
ncbi:MAG: glycine zipper 2TM domain-containing protein [Verrucomicrobiota bacterium]